MFTYENRWLIALSAIGIHICIGSVYAWSVLTKPIMQAMGFTLKETTWTFSIAILFLGLSAGFLGDYVEKYGPRKSGLTSTCFFGLGMFGTALALHLNSLPLLYLFYGVIGGIGLGTGYITPVSTLVKWFPNNRGFATGLAIMGFGFASLIAGPLMQILVAKYGLVQNFIILGCVYMVIMPPPPYILNHLKQAMAGRPALTSKVSSRILSSQPKKHAKPGNFTHCGGFFHQYYLRYRTFSSSFTDGTGSSKMTPMAAASMVGIIGLINGLGRIFWSTISDYLGRSTVYVVFFLIQIFAFYALAETSSAFIFQLIVFVIISCYGGGFSCMPAFLSDLFGTKELSAIHGKILTAWGMAGIAGPLLLSWIRETTNSYSITLYFFSACFVVSLIIAGILKWRTSVGVLIEKKHL